MRRFPLLVAVVMLAACASTPAGGASPRHGPSPKQSPSATPSTLASASASPSSAPTRAAYGLFVDGTLATYSILLVGTDGKIAAQAQATMPAVYRYMHFPPAPPVVSVTNSRVYYADGGSIKYLQPDGSTGVVMPYPGGPQTAAGFAVSLDDRRISVALLTFQGPDNFQAKLDLYVEDLGGGNRVELLSSTTVVEWPVAWTSGHLVLAVGPAVVDNVSSNPYNGFKGYHVADAATGERLVTMWDDCLLGPLEPTGTACSSGGQVIAQAYDGTNRVLSPSAGAQLFLALSPDGSRIAARPGPQGSPMVLFNSSGTVTSEAESGIPMGWIDDQHLVFYGPNGFERNILDLVSGSVIPVPACSCGNSGVFFGVLAPAP